MKISKFLCSLANWVNNCLIFKKQDDQKKPLLEENKLLKENLLKKEE